GLAVPRPGVVPALRGDGDRAAAQARRPATGPVRRDLRGPRMSAAVGVVAEPVGRLDARTRWLRRVLPAVVLVVLAVLPYFLTPYPIGIAGRMLSFALLVVSVDLLTGLTGLPTLAQIAYFGVGAYTAGLVGIHWTTNLFAQLGIGVLVAAA